MVGTTIDTAFASARQYAGFEPILLGTPRHAAREQIGRGDGLVLFQLQGGGAFRGGGRFAGWGGGGRDLAMGG